MIKKSILMTARKNIKEKMKFLKISHLTYLLAFSFLHETTLAMNPTGETEVDKNYRLYMKFQNPEAKLELLEEGRGGYKHFFKCEPQPTLEPQESYEAYLKRLETWVKGGFSQATYNFVDRQGLLQPLSYPLPIDKAPRYSHQVQFIHVSDDKERHETTLKAQQYFKTFDNDVINCGEPLQICLPHILCRSSLDQMSHYLYYAFTTLSLAQSLSQTYTFPSLGLVEQDLRYDTTFKVIEGGTIQTLALKASPEPDQGYYSVKMREQEKGSFLYSTGKKLYLARKMKVICHWVNEESPQKYTFEYAEPTDHLIQVRSTSHIDHPLGFLPEGVYMYEQLGWIRINNKLESEGKPIHIWNRDQLYFQSVIVGSHKSSFQALRDLRSFSQVNFVDEFNFAGHVFKHHPDPNLDERVALVNLLKRSTHLRSLILSKEDKTVSYDDLVETLLWLPNLKILDVTNGLISKENFKRLTSKLGLQVLGAAVN